ncbi:MAG: DUF1553 domain-containing protein [Planctomycetaceae bacterium]
MLNRVSLLWFCGLWTLWSVGLATVGVASARGAEQIVYNRDIRPLLSDNCFSCHGPSEAGRGGDLRLDVREAALEGDAFVPGRADESELIRRIRSTDPDVMMPPPASKKTLTAEQRQLLTRWVEEGAQYQPHWSFITPEKPPVPQVDDGGWARNDIDRFVLARLQAHGLKPSPEADRATLIRRVALDLTGLPPTVEELDRFLADSSEAGYSQMIDYYFSRPAYGERMALAWLDSARYGDTSVLHADGPRYMWPWRDWVIRSFNNNQPFDQFSIEQIAGDLIPNATVDQKIASGFNRNHATTDEGGAIAEEWRVDYVVDRVQTTSNVWLGLSMECGQCHSHKFDPISQKEYYAFFAFFNQTSDPGMQTRKGNQAPIVNVPDAVRDQKISELEATLAGNDKAQKEHVANCEPQFIEWLTSARRELESKGGPQPPGDLLAHFPFDELSGKAVTGTLSTAKNQQHKGKVNGKELWQPGKFGNGFAVDGSNFIDLGDIANFDRDEAFTSSCWVRPDGVPNGAPVAKMDEGDSHRGWDMLFQNGQLTVHIIHNWPSNAIKIITKNQLPKDEWGHICVTYDGSGKAAGVKVYFNGELQPWDAASDSLTGTTKSKVPLKIGRRNNSGQFKGIVDDLRLYGRELTSAEAANLAGSDPIAPLLAIASESIEPEQLATLRTHYLTTIDAENLRLIAEQKELTGEIESLKKQVVTSMVMGEQEKPRDTFLLMRGSYAAPDTSEVIKPNVPSIFPPLPAGAPQNRLGLAQWMFAPENPLTARVAINRYWAMLFGQGIVVSSMDFGSQGTWPTHPELLDWLAVDFRENGWDTRRALKQMMMSATYRQTSRKTPELAEKDPQNQLLARGARFRLQGEFIRDTALAVSGLMVDQVGGPSVKPYQPPGLWFEVSLTGERFTQDKGADLYRKSMYIYWKRSAPHPGMQIFDAPTREKCVVQRAVTNTPLQALYAMNDVQFVEAARNFAERLLTSSEQTPESRLRLAYRQVTSQEPSERTMQTLLKLLQDEQTRFASNEAAAKELLSVGESKRNEALPLTEHAAWTVVTNVLLNLDQALTRY